MYNSSSNAYGGARPKSIATSTDNIMYNNSVNRYQPYSGGYNERYKGQDYRYHPQYANNTRDQPYSGGYNERYKGQDYRYHPQYANNTRPDRS